MWCPLSETKHYNRLKIRTLSSMTSVLDKHIMPYFSDIPLNKIPPQPLGASKTILNLNCSQTIKIIPSL